MDKKNLLRRITINPNVMVGKPVIKGTRLTVQFILGLLAHGQTMDDIKKEYPNIEREDITACLIFATKTLDSSTFLPINNEQS
ncbi:MAG: DUF433 domain-containing protein [bacterium]